MVRVGDAAVGGAPPPDPDEGAPPPDPDGGGGGAAATPVAVMVTVRTPLPSLPSRVHVADTGPSEAGVNCTDSCFEVSATMVVLLVRVEVATKPWESGGVDSVIKSG